MTDKISMFAEAWTYTSSFRTHEGDNVEFKSVCLVRPGFDFLTIFNSWCGTAGHSYICTGKISTEDALKLPTLPDRLSLLGKLDLVGDTIMYLTHEYEMRYI